MKSIIEITYQNSTISIGISLWLIVILLTIALLLLAARFLSSKFKDDVELEINLGNVGKVKLKPNNEVKQIAHKAWVELSTRKAGLKIDKDNDVIKDVYDSWYNLFGEIRELARNVPASKLKDKDTKLLVDILIKTLNEGMRPHLTRWQARYRRWYDKAVESEDNNDLTPQEIQNNYKEYQPLVDDMILINEQLVQYTIQLKKLVDA
ncbi:MAG: hypothetical protein JWO54_356 [Candidatus Saccharibacteria bacterium]|nr:hypothetical protein [Candidatus Saccharibacteria bacterium]